MLTPDLPSGFPSAETRPSPCLPLLSRNPVRHGPRAGRAGIFQLYLSILEHTYTSSTHLALSWTLLPPVSPRSDRTRETPEKVSLPFGRIPLPGRGVGRQGNPEHHPPLRIPQDPSSHAKGRYWGSCVICGMHALCIWITVASTRTFVFAPRQTLWYRGSLQEIHVRHASLSPPQRWSLVRVAHSSSNAWSLSSRAT